MRSRMSWIFLLLAVVTVAGQLFIPRAYAAPAYVTGSSDPDAELSLWGIENGCLNSALVHHFYVLNAHAAMIELIGGKRVLMRFRGDCQGIEQYGFVHTAQNNRVCPSTNAIRVLHTGARCEVESLEPYHDNRQ